jgi:hypothetical protein
MRRRTPFVWLADQPVDHAAGFATLRGGPLRRETDGINRWILARGRFDGGPGGEGRLSITVDGRYRLWLNGAATGRGPVRASPHFQRYDQHVVPLAAGFNHLAMLIHVPGVDLAWYETVKGAWQPVFGDGGLFAEATIDGAIPPIAWKMIASNAWQRDTARAGWGQDFIEDHDARLLDPDWTQPDFDDGAWPAARPMVSLGNATEKARGFGRVEPFPALQPSLMPAMAEQALAPDRLLWVRAAGPRPDLPLEARLYAEPLLEEAGALVENPASLTDPNDGNVTIVRTAGGRATVLMLAFDPCHAGRPFLEIDAKGGERVEIAVAESLPGEFGIGRDGDGLSHAGHLGVAPILGYTARPGRQRFERFNWTAVRAMQVVVRDAPAGIAIRRLGSIAIHYPAGSEGAFECSDPLLNRLWALGRHTVLQCMHDGWVDCPGREARQWVGDGVVQFDIAALAFGPSVYPLQRLFLHHAAENQRADGLVRMFAPGDNPADGLVIPEFTLLWILSIERYHRQSADDGTVRRLMPHIELAFAWFERHLDENGLLADIPHWHFIEWADLGRAGESAPINALFAGALAATVRLAGAIGRADLVERYEAIRVIVVAALHARHWNPDRGVYVDAVDPGTGTQGNRVSQHGNALMLAFADVPPERHAALLAAITDDNRLKLTAAPPIVPHAPPFDESTDIVRANSFFAHFIDDGIATAGRFDWVLRAMRAGFGPMLDAGATTLWESFSPDASLCHGFSATPVYQLSRHCLGVSPLTPGYARFALAPQPGDLAWAKGVIPTPAGPIAVTWERAKERLRVAVEHPAGCEMVVPDRADWALLSRKDRAGRATLLFEAC